MSENKSTHQMIMDSHETPGFEEWYCPSCGRRVLMKWQPKFRKIIVETGDETVNHAAWKINPEGVYQDTSLNEHISKDSLAPWQEWAHRVGFDSLWDDKNQDQTG